MIIAKAHALWLFLNQVLVTGIPLLGKLRSHVAWMQRSEIRGLDIPRQSRITFHFIRAALCLVTSNVVKENTGLSYDVKGGFCREERK